MATEGREFGWEDTIKEDAQEFEPLPEGDYNVTIEKFDRSRSSGSGKLPACNMAVVYFNVHAPNREITIRENYESKLSDKHRKGIKMKNIKEQVYKALCSVTDNVSDAYPHSWAEDATIQYTEEQNSVYEHSSHGELVGEDKSLVRYRIDIWHRDSTSAAAMAVDEAMKETGLKRIECQDVPDPSGMKHKQMRYEGIIDMDSDEVYWR